MEFVVIGMPSKDRVHLVILCPFCGEIHLHGAGKPLEELAYGARVPHCVGLKTTPSYTIVPAPSVEVEDVLRESIKRKAAKKGVTL